MLAEERTLSLPDNASVTGGMLDRHDLLVWGPHHVWQFKTTADDSVAVLIESPDAVVIAAELDAEGVLALRLTSSNALTLSRLSPYNRQLAVWRLPFRPEQARKCGGGWYIGGRDGSRFYEVVRLVKRQAIRMWSSAYASGSVTPYTLSCIGEHIAVTDVAAPFATMTIATSPDGNAVLRSPRPDSTDFGTALFPTWISSPVFPLGRWSLQVLAELRGDRRLFVLYDSNGRELRRRGLEAPLGLLATSENSPHILATRRARGTEVILYRWRWAESLLGTS